MHVKMIVLAPALSTTEFSIAWCNNNYISNAKRLDRVYIKKTQATRGIFSMLLHN